MNKDRAKPQRRELLILDDKKLEKVCYQKTSPGNLRLVVQNSKSGERYTLQFHSGYLVTNNPKIIADLDEHPDRYIPLEEGEFPTGKEDFARSEDVTPASPEKHKELKEAFKFQEKQNQELSEKLKELQREKENILKAVKSRDQKLKKLDSKHKAYDIKNPYSEE